jgi:hypothetical protein
MHGTDPDGIASNVEREAGLNSKGIFFEDRVRLAIARWLEKRGKILRADR